MLTKLESERLRQTFAAAFPEATAESFFAPSRINIIGEHTDYNGGQCLPAALEIGSYGLFAKTEEPLICLKSLNIPYEETIPLHDLSYQESRSWLNYATGMARFLQEEGYRAGGLCGVIYGNIPNGAGLSSSASLELLLGQAWNALYNEGQIAALDLVKLGKRVENEQIGLNSGIMDQFAIGMGKKDHAIRLNTNTLEYKYYPLELADCCFVIMNTNKRRELKDSKYNERQAECQAALGILRQTYAVDYLCALSTEQLEAVASDFRGEEVLYKRARHVIAENERVTLAAAAMASGDLTGLGKLLDASHESLAKLYEVTGPHLDAIVAAAQASPHCLGARMTGAGFGGCALALVKQSGLEAFTMAVKAAYLEQTGLEAELFSSQAGDGAGRVQSLLL